MGLDTSHNAWHGSYGSFNKFRYWLADRIGINLDDYNGYGQRGTKDLSTINHGIRPLLDHSDCDGELSPEDCKTVADGLDLIIKAVVPNDDLYGFYKCAIQFREGCLLAHSQNETIDFH